MAASADYYQVLGVNPAATEGEIKRAYHAAAKKAHPDAGGSQAEMQRVNEAYHTLSDPLKRRDYDRERVGPEPAVETSATHTHEAHHPHRAPDPAAQARARADFVKLRRAQARSVALQMMLRSLLAVLVVDSIAHFLSSPAGTPTLERWLLDFFGFIPVYFFALSVVFLVDPDLRLEIFDLAHDRSFRSLLHLARLLATMALPFFPLAIIWVWLSPL
jgi:hypothetical protein